MTIPIAKLRRLPLCMIVSFISWYLPFRFAPALLTLDLVAPENGLFQVYFDMGAGFSERQSHKVEVQGSGLDRTVSFQVPARGIRALRIDPGQQPGTVHLRAIGLRYAFGSYRWPSAEVSGSFRPLNQIGQFSESEGGFSVVSTGTDPMFTYIGDPEPVFELVRIEGYAGLVLASLLTALVLCLIWPLKWWTGEEAGHAEPSSTRDAE